MALLKSSMLSMVVSTLVRLTGLVRKSQAPSLSACTAVSTVPKPVAADGIDEFLAWFAGRGPAAGAQPVAGSVHLHCTDADRLPSGAGGEWMVTSLDAEHGAAFTREHAKGDAAVRGRSDQLLLWLWRRSDRGVEILGDAEVAERFRSFTDLD